MASLFELLLEGFVAVKLSVDRDVDAVIFAGDGLIACGEIDDAEARMPQSNAAVRGDPTALAIRAAMEETLRGALERCWRDGFPAGKERDNSTHGGVPSDSLDRVVSWTSGGYHDRSCTGHANESCLLFEELEVGCGCETMEVARVALSDLCKDRYE
jgi:hypothetical protein